MKRKLQLEIIDPTGVTVRTHHFFFETIDGNRLLLTIGDNRYVLTDSGKLLNVLNEEKPNAEDD